MSSKVGAGGLQLAVFNGAAYALKPRDELSLGIEFLRCYFSVGDVSGSGGLAHQDSGCPGNF